MIIEGTGVWKMDCCCSWATEYSQERDGKWEWDYKANYSVRKSCIYAFTNYQTCKLLIVEYVYTNGQDSGDWSFHGLPFQSKSTGLGTSKFGWDGKGNICPDVIIGAAIRGDLKVLQPPTHASPDSAQGLDQHIETIDPSSEIVRRSTAAQYETRSIEVYDYLDCLLENT